MEGTVRYTSPFLTSNLSLPPISPISLIAPTSPTSHLPPLPSPNSHAQVHYPSSCLRDHRCHVSAAGFQAFTPTLTQEGHRRYNMQPPLAAACRCHAAIQLADGPCVQTSPVFRRAVAPFLKKGATIEPTVPLAFVGFVLANLALNWCVACLTRCPLHSPPHSVSLLYTADAAYASHSAPLRYALSTLCIL